jgi:guanine deaminase
MASHWNSDMTPRSHPDLSPEQWARLREALDLAYENAQSGPEGGGPFGAVIAPTAGGPVLARGTNGVTRLCDPTAHAEVVAIRAAGAALSTHDLRGYTLYTSCEPCPMCLAAALWARLDSVIYASTRQDAEAAGFDDAHFYREVSLPPTERALPCRNALREEGHKAFTAWLANPRRTPY